MKFALIDVGATQFMIRYYFYSKSICNEPIRFDSVRLVSTHMLRLNTNAELLQNTFSLSLHVYVQMRRSEKKS